MVQKNRVSRRRLLGVGSAMAASAALSPRLSAAPSSKPALLGGSPVKAEPFPSWPVWDSSEEAELSSVLRSGKWG